MRAHMTTWRLELTGPAEQRPAPAPPGQLEFRQALWPSPELDGGIEPDAEIAYLGVMPAFIGRRPGAWLLTTAILRGFAMGAKRVRVHTCTLDSPNALANYRARGMRVFKEHDEPIDLPDETPGPWPGAGIRGPHMPASSVRRRKEESKSKA